MEELKNKNDFLQKIDVEKELLTAIPKNNKKNIQKYIDKIEELIGEYSNYKVEIQKNLINRFENVLSIKSNIELVKLQKQIDQIENKLYLLSDSKTSYEKMGLDRSIYKLEEYQKGNLENINNEIYECIKKFKQVGIDLDLSDFDYSLYVKQYMQVFFKEMNTNNINSPELKAKFEEVYWKCPEIIIHIELNIRNIYLENQKKIDKYLEKEKIELLKEYNKKPEEIKEIYLNKKQQKKDIEIVDYKNLLLGFLNGKSNLKDFSEDKIKSYYNRILPENIELSKSEIENNIFKFLDSLYEYKNYMEFKFIVDDIKNYYKEREKYKTVYEDTIKKIKVNEKKLRKINKRTFNRIIFFRNKKQLSGQNKLLLDLKQLYLDLDENKFYNKIYSCLNNESTIYDVLNLANSYYKYLISCFKKNIKNIEQQELEEKIIELNRFLNSGNNTVITNINFLEEKDIGIIIRDRYRLLNFIVENDFNIAVAEDLISVLKNITKSFCFEKSGLKLDKVEELLEIKKVLKI